MGDVRIPARKDGWCLEGIKRFNALCRFVQDVRLDAQRVNKINTLIRARVALEIAAEVGDNDKSKQRRRKRKRMEEEVEEEEPFSSSVVFD